jgi:hypothetical protein
MAVGMRGILWRGSASDEMRGRDVATLTVTDRTETPLRPDSAPPEPTLAIPAPASGAITTAADESVASTTKESAELALMGEALRLVDQGRKRYASIHDYTCLFTKRERMSNGRVVGPQVLAMKVRTQPRAIYFKFLKPHAGREAIWIDGQFENKMLVHDVGLGKLLAGTLRIDPTSRMAMDDNRHPITEAGLGFLLDELAAHWAVEMKPGEIEVQIARDAQVGDRPCILVESRHPEFAPEYRNHKVKVYFDRELSLPIRFEAYDWPNKQGKVEMIEEYMYVDLKLDPGLEEADFDPTNPLYSFGRF